MKRNKSKIYTCLEDDFEPMLDLNPERMANCRIASFDNVIDQHFVNHTHP